MLSNSKDANIEKAKAESVEGQLQNALDPQGQSYKVVSHAYDGFTTRNVLEKGVVGYCLRILHHPQGGLTFQLQNYFSHKNVTAFGERRPLDSLEERVKLNSKSKHYVVISVGGNDFRELLSTPLSLFREIPNIRARYLEIVNRVKALSPTNVHPILMFQYRPGFTPDPYGIYTILKVAGLFLAAVQSLSIGTIGISAIALLAHKITQRSAFIFTLIGTLGLILTTQVMSLKTTAGIWKGQQAGIALLGDLMERFYRPILQQAAKDRIPVLDLPNVFNPLDRALYTSQIEPSVTGGKMIARGLAKIIKSHDFSEKSYIYDHFSQLRSENTPNEWRVRYPS
jgi:hypothetical protein